MRKAFKKLLASLLALAMVCALAAPVFADDTMENLSNHKFTAYQIFTGDVATVGNDTKLSNADWGADVDIHAILTDLSTKSDFTSRFNGITTASSAADVVAKMAGMNETDAVTIAFAKMVATHLTGTGTPFTGTSFAAPKAGYYLIKDTTTFSSTDPNKYHTYQFSLLKVTQAGTVTITSKAAKPSVKIEVQKSDGSWDNSTDAAIGDTCKFRLTATLPESSNHNAYDYYDNYTIWFSNDLSAGFSEMSEPTIITDNGTSLNITDQDVHYTSTQNGFGLMIENLADHTANLNLGSTVIVEFTAKLNSKAAITTKSGVNTTNTSTVQLSFSNDPAHSDSITSGMGTTAKDTAYVHTYGMDILKIASDTSRSLPGAKFELYSDPACNTELKFTKDNTGAYCYDANGTAEMVSDADGKIKINGLKPSTYYLKETEAPAGYNKVDDPIAFTFGAIHDATGASVTLTISNKMTLEDTGPRVVVVNKAGVVLPSTGGIGTTIFYVVGGLLMVGAAVLLVTKKRMENN